MGWFKRSPRIIDPDLRESKALSPMTERLLKESKEAVRAKSPPKKKTKKDYERENREQEARSQEA